MEITKIIIAVATLLVAQSANIFAQVSPTAKDSPTTSNRCVSGNCVNGKGKMACDNGSVYEGDFVNGKFEGNGTLTYVEDSYYTGRFKNGLLEGKGKFVFYDGDTYEGDFVNDKYEGQGTLTVKDGSYHIGGFKNDNKNGYGKEYDKSKKLVREGIWKNDVFVSSATAVTSPSKTNVFVSSTTGVLVPTASPTPTNATVTSPNSANNETATLLRDTLNGKFGYSNSKPLVYEMKRKKSGESLRYQIEFINDGSKLAFKWKELTKNEQSEKLIITDNALNSASKYVNFFTVKSALSPDKEITFILSQTLYQVLKSKNEINLDLGKGLQRMSFNYNSTALIGTYTDKNLKILYFQGDDGKTTMKILDDPICPLIVGIETAEYTFSLENS